MKNYRKSLPPLDNLLFFHAAAGSKNLTRAADALFVTQAAVSKRIQRLEDWLGASLFSRDGRNLELTSAGRELASDVEMALEFLDRAIHKLKAPEQPAVQITASTALSMFWLHKRLKAFSFSDMACDVNIHTTDTTSDLLSQAQDLAVVYCNGNIPGWDCVKILEVEMFPVAAPDIARQAEQSKVFSRQPQLEDSPPLLEFDNLAPDWINWQTWSKKVEFTDFEKRSKVHCNSYVQSVGKALNGAGIALVNGSMLEEELSSGALVRIGEPSLRPRSAYYLCKKQGGGLSLNALALFQFLTT